MHYGNTYLVFFELTLHITDYRLQKHGSIFPCMSYFISMVKDLGIYLQYIFVWDTMVYYLTIDKHVVWF